MMQDLTLDNKSLNRLYYTSRTTLDHTIVRKNGDVNQFKTINEPAHEISNNVVCATSKTSDQPAHTRSLIRAFASHLSIL